VQTTKQQQILGYFIEEAKEHLDSIEHGLLNLSDTMADAEEMNQVFRAAHSIKGGAAMLGFNSIQRVAHHFEDYFKLLKENPVRIDQKLEDLFLKGFDGLKALIDQLQSTFGLRDDEAEQIVKATEPVFAELGRYLNLLINGESTAASQTATSVGNTATEQVSKILKVMLQLFKQGDNPKSRQQLVALCTRLMQLSPKNKAWLLLGQTAQKAIANPNVPYPVLAPLIIKELKQGSDLLIAGRSSEIVPSTSLKQLAQKQATGRSVDLAAAQMTALRVNPEPIVNAKAASMTSIQPLPSAATVQQVVVVENPAIVAGARQRTISVPTEPKAAARALLDAFSKDELIQLAEFLMKAIQS
jgi:chemotaxis protein histidine kinase CheA